MGQRQGIFSDELKRSIVKAGMQARTDNTMLLALWWISSVVFTVLVCLWSIAGTYGISVYASNWVTQYPNLPLTESFIVMAYTFIAVITKAVIIGNWIFMVLYMVLLAVSEDEATRLKRTGKPIFRDNDGYLVYDEKPKEKDEL